MIALAFLLHITGALAFSDLWRLFGGNPLHHLGGNSPWFPGPKVFGLSPASPSGCTIDQVAFVARHGSRYPDPSAYYQWTNLSAKIQAQKFETTAPELQFLQTWRPVVNDPDHELSLLSHGGWKELCDMGVRYRYDYPSLYQNGEPFYLWANRYQTGQPRVIDSARLFARGYLGPDASELGTVLVVNNSDPRSFGKSLAASDLCPAYSDNSGGANATTWANLYLPPIVDRINSKLQGLQFNSSDVSIFPYLCGFETQIAGRRSPWCDVFLHNETLDYEYAQDLRYWYGNGLGSQVGADMMLPFLTDLVQRFVDGPNATYLTSDNAVFKPNKLIAAFTNDGQINQLVSGSGIFDFESALPPSYNPPNRMFVSSNFVTMRGTINFERLNCGGEGIFLRLKLNDRVYPISRCQNGPGKSCALRDYQKLIAAKAAGIGSFAEICGVSNNSVATAGGQTTFLQDPDLPFVYSVSP